MPCQPRLALPGVALHLRGKCTLGHPRFLGLRAYRHRPEPRRALALSPCACAVRGRAAGKALRSLGVVAEAAAQWRGRVPAFRLPKPAIGGPYAQRANECSNAGAAIGFTVLEQTP